MNINAQCTRCNHFLSGNLSVYAIYLLKKYGKKKLEDLDNRAKFVLKGEKITDEWYEEKIQYYKQKLLTQ